MSARSQDRQRFWEEEQDDTPRRAGYMDSVRSRLRDAFSSVAGGYGTSPATERDRADEYPDEGGDRFEDVRPREPAARFGEGRGAPVPHRSSSHFAKPPRFDGNSISWDEFIMQFETCADINGWHEVEMGQHLFVNLEGEARSFIVSLRLPRLEYQVLVRKLEGWFGSVDRQESFRSQLQNRRRQQGEAATSYASDMGCLVARAYPGYPEEILRQMTLKALLDGLPEGDLKHEIQMLNPQSVETAVRLIERWENSSRKGRPQVRAVGEEKPTEQGDQGALLSKILEMLMSLGAKPAREPKKRFTGKCYGCGEEGHFKYNCPQGQGKQGN